MKICMLTDAWMPWWGGGQAHIWEVSQRLVKDYGCLVDIVVPNLTDKTGKIYPGREVYENGRLKVLRLGPRFIFPRFFGRLLFILYAFRYTLFAGYDIYHSHSYSTTIFLPLLGLLKRKKTVYTLHGLGSSGLGAGLINRSGLPAILSNLIVNIYRYDALITVAGKSLNGKVATRKTFIIGNGVDLQKFKSLSAHRDKKAFRFLWVGRFVEVKGLPVLIKAAQNIASRFPRFRLTLVGEGPEKAKIKDLVAATKLEKKVDIKPALYGEDLIREYKSSHAFVLPSLSAEGFPLTLVDAMACRLPVIASDIGDVGLLIKDGKTGYLTDPGNPQDLAAKMEKILESPIGGEMGEEGYKLVEKYYTWKHISMQIFKVYEDIVSS